MTAYMLNLRDPDKTMLSAPGGKNVNLSELMRFANIIVPKNRVERLMKELGIRAKHKKKFKVTIDS